MARIEWVKLRLNNWALWRVREMSGGMGFAKSAAFLLERVDTSRESVLPVDDVDAEVTNQAVESLKLGKGHLFVTLQHIYIKGVGIKETARLMSRAESTVKANLDQADHVLSQWFGERREAKEQQAKRSFTT